MKGVLTELETDVRFWPKLYPNMAISLALGITFSNVIPMNLFFINLDRRKSYQV